MQALVEYANTLLEPSDSRLKPLGALADSSEMIIVVGCPIVSDKGLHIGAISFIPGGGTQVYLKQYLHDGEEVAFAPGEGGDALFVDKEQIRLAICVDILNPAHAREAAKHGASIYAASCVITPQGYEPDASLLAGYAGEHRMVVLMANYGAATSKWQSAVRSAIGSNNGTLLACGPKKGESVVVCPCN